MPSYPVSFGDLDEWLGSRPCYPTFPVQPADRTMVVWDGGMPARVNKQHSRWSARSFVRLPICCTIHTRGARRTR